MGSDIQPENLVPSNYFGAVSTAVLAVVLWLPNVVSPNRCEALSLLMLADCYGLREHGVVTYLEWYGIFCEIVLFQF